MKTEVIEGTWNSGNIHRKCKIFVSTRGDEGGYMVQDCCTVVCTNTYSRNACTTSDSVGSREKDFQHGKLRQRSRSQGVGHDVLAIIAKNANLNMVLELSRAQSLTFLSHLLSKLLMRVAVTLAKM